MGQSSGGGPGECGVSTLAIFAPASANSIEEFLGRAYAKPLVGLYASNGEDWQASRDSVVRVLQGTPSDELESEARWFLAVHDDVDALTAPLSAIREYDGAEYHDLQDLLTQLREGLYVGFVGDRIMAHGSSCREVLEGTISEGWAHLEEPSSDYSKMSDLPSVKGMVESIKISRLSP